MAARFNFTVSLLVIAAFALGACSSDKKPPLPGQRISVLQYQDSSRADKEAQKTPVKLGAPQENLAWPQQGGNASHTPQNLALYDGRLKKAWSASVGEGSKKDRKLITAPIAADGMVFAADTTGNINAYNIANGKRLWRVSVLANEDDATVSSGLAYNKGVLFVADGIGNVLALDAKDGRKIWTRVTEQPVRGSPTVQGDRVYVITLSDETLALNAANGEILWRHEGVQEAASFLGSPSPAVEGSVVISPYSSGDVVALRSETGQEAWSDNLTGAAEAENRAVTQLAGFHGSPVLDQDVVYLGNASTRMVAVHVPSGERVWQKEFGLLTTPWLSGNMVYVITSQNELVALLKETGQIRWALPLPHFEDPKDREDAIFWEGPILAGGRLLLVSSNERLLEVDVVNGKILRETDLPDKVMLPPVVANKMLLILTDDGEMVAYK
ncbi:MAG: Pyrrolo-quinoline quinone [Alphaproteobacteria bacterium]|nr:Pyrrolo-quinoline quinone [Alphaproteobacteria bacterium]